MTVKEGVELRIVVVGVVLVEVGEEVIVELILGVVVGAPIKIYLMKKSLI